MIKVFPIDFLGRDAMLQPKNPELFNLAVEFCKKELLPQEDGLPLNLAHFEKVWVAAEVDESGKPVSVCGITGWRYKPDIPLFRTINAAATTKLHHRLHNYFADNGCIGAEVFIHISGKESPEQRCANWENELLAAGAKPADRLSVIVAPK